MKFYFFDHNDNFLFQRTDAVRFIVYERDLAFEGTFPPYDLHPITTGQRVAWKNDEDAWEIYEIDRTETDAFGNGVNISGVHLCVAELRDWMRITFEWTDTAIATVLDSALGGTQWTRGTVDGDTGEAATVDTYKVTGGSVNLRSGPGTSYKVVTVYHKNDRLTLIKKTNANWYKVQGPDGRTGYINTQYIAFVSSGSGKSSSTITIERQEWQTAWENTELVASTAKMLLIPTVDIPADGSAWVRQINLVTTEPEYNGVRISCNANFSDGSIIYDSGTQYNRLYGLGKNNLDFGDVVWTVAGGNPADKPAGQKYINLPADEYAALDRNGHPRVGLVQFDDETSASKLLQRTWDELQKLKTPQITVDAVIADLYKMGYGGQAMRLYDAVQLILEPVGIRIEARIIDLQRDLINPENTRPTIGTQLGADILDNITVSSNLR